MVLPLPSDIPSELKRKDGSFPRQIITPGLFKGTYSLHGVEILLFKYKDEHEIHGLKVSYIKHFLLHYQDEYVQICGITILLVKGQNKYENMCCLLILVW